MNYVRTRRRMTAKQTMANRTQNRLCKCARMGPGGGFGFAGRQDTHTHVHYTTRRLELLFNWIKATIDVVESEGWSINIHTESGMCTVHHTHIRTVTNR